MKPRQGDIVVVPMPSNPQQTPWSLRITEHDLRAGRLNRPGTIRADKIYTLAQSLVVNRFGVGLAGDASANPRDTHAGARHPYAIAAARRRTAA